MANENQKTGNESTQLERRPEQSSTMSRGFDPFFPSPREFFTANPFSLMRRMSEEMDRMFGEFGLAGSQGERNLWSFPIEISERDGQYVVHAELPGLKPEDIKVEVNGNSLVIQGERRYEQNTGEGGVRRTERRYGQFYRAITLPEGIRPEQVNAKFDNGLLEVSVPVPQNQANRRQIPVQTGSSTGGRPSQSTTSGASSSEPRQVA
jgi:HSP20 family protein